MRNSVRFILVFVFLFSISGCFEKKREEKIAVIPLGKVDERLLQQARAAIEEFYHFHVDIVEPMDLPAGSYHKRSRRYDSSMIVHWLGLQYEDRYDKVLGLTEADIYHARKGKPYRRVIGLGLVRGRSALVSLYRYLRDRRSGDEKLYERLAKTVIHEIGHTYGLKHCEQGEFCIMKKSDAKLRKIDKKHLAFCDSCLMKINDKELFTYDEPGESPAAD